MLSGKRGEAIRKSMEILVALGDIYDAGELIPVSNAHISGVSIKTVGDAGLRYLEEMSELGAKTEIPATLNPACMDLERWRELGIPRDLAEKQLRIIKSFKKMGVAPTCTCTPYLEKPPAFGDHLAWSESSAIIFANSVLGARSNREGSPSALASAITGLTPKYGYHLEENRRGNLKVIPEPQLFEDDETWHYSVLGYWIGKSFPESVPVIEGVHPTSDQLKAMGAAMAASGAITLYHVSGLTPEAKRKPEICEVKESVNFGRKEFEDVVARLDQVQDADLTCIGCPHCSLKELEKISGKTPKNKTWICLSRELMKRAGKIKLAENTKLVCDTCMVVAPMKEIGYSSIAVDSAKAAHYIPTLVGAKVHFAPLKELFE
jgi:hypothetical protein